MKKCLIMAAICMAACARYKAIPFRGEGGETIYVRDNGLCDYAKNGTPEEHRVTRQTPPIVAALFREYMTTGRVYGIAVITGKLVPPGEKGEPDKEKVIWMCRWHIAQWVGIDPVTGERAAWMPPRKVESR